MAPPVQSRDGGSQRSRRALGRRGLRRSSGSPPPEDFAITGQQVRAGREPCQCSVEPDASTGTCEEQRLRAEGCGTGGLCWNRLGRPWLGAGVRRCHGACAWFVTRVTPQSSLQSTSGVHAGQCFRLSSTPLTENSFTWSSAEHGITAFLNSFVSFGNRWQSGFVLG